MTKYRIVENGNRKFYIEYSYTFWPFWQPLKGWEPFAARPTVSYYDSLDEAKERIERDRAEEEHSARERQRDIRWESD